jgi:hypothetical protein
MLSTHPDTIKRDVYWIEMTLIAYTCEVVFFSLKMAANLREQSRAVRMALPQEPELRLPMLSLHEKLLTLQTYHWLIAIHKLADEYNFTFDRHSQVVYIDFRGI